MSETVFDSRKLDALSFFCCKLTVGNYVVSSPEAPDLTGALVVAASDSFASVTFTTDAKGHLAFLNPPPFNTSDAFYTTFNYFGGSEPPADFSVQLNGPTPIDSSKLQPDQLFGYNFDRPGPSPTMPTC